ncbi:MAG: preprotein translocase subunit SecE [Candidatus Paceibacterota bacterium]
MKITEYIKESKAELKHVNWPTRNQTAVFSGIVVAISAVGAIYLGLLDSGFKVIIEKVFGF